MRSRRQGAGAALARKVPATNGAPDMKLHSSHTAAQERQHSLLHLAGAAAGLRQLADAGGWQAEALRSPLAVIEAAGSPPLLAQGELRWRQQSCSPNPTLQNNHEGWSTADVHCMAWLRP